MEKNQKIKAVLFDLDGTLVDTAPDFVLSLNNILTRHGFPSLEPSLIRSNVSDGSAKLTSLGFGINKDDPDFDKLRKEFLDEYKIGNIIILKLTNICFYITKFRLTNAYF